MFKVKYWKSQFEKGQFPKTDEEYQRVQTHSEYKTLKEAKKACRRLGHTGEDVSMLKGYPPIAFVANGEEIVYIPRFKKEKS